MSLEQAIVIVGGGHAAAQLCVGLVEAGQGDRVHLVCEESTLPYHRPPLSKTFLKSDAETLQPIRPDAWFADSGVTVHRRDPAVGIDRTHRTVRLASGTELSYGNLVLATGSRARRVPGVPEGTGNLALLRSAEDAVRLRALVGAAERITVLGGGFIGLEIAATARGLGKAVTVIEMAPRLLTRAVSPELSEYVADFHRAAGVTLKLAAKVDGIDVVDGRVVALTVSDETETVDLLVAGIGAVPECSLALAAGLVCDNGVVVDSAMRTSDPAIFAVGDCASFPAGDPGRRLRLESVQNANDQARTAVAVLLGRDEPYRALPWFWSEQGALRLQMAGLMPADGVRHRRPGPAVSSFSILHYVGERLACVESVNAPMDHMMSRKLLEAGRSPPPGTACDPAIALKSLL